MVFSGLFRYSAGMIISLRISKLYSRKYTDDYLKLVVTGK